MSEQRKMRAELRQGLHQFLMQLYLSYTQTLDKKQVIEQISGVLKEEHEYFTGQTLSMPADVGATLKEIATDYEKKARTSTSYEEQMQYSEDMESLMKAYEILAKERGR